MKTYGIYHDEQASRVADKTKASRQTRKQLSSSFQIPTNGLVLHAATMQEKRDETRIQGHTKSSQSDSRVNFAGRDYSFVFKNELYWNHTVHPDERDGATAELVFSV